MDIGVRYKVIYTSGILLEEEMNKAAEDGWAFLAVGERYVIMYKMNMQEFRLDSLMTRKEIIESIGYSESGTPR